MAAETFQTRKPEFQESVERVLARFEGVDLTSLPEPMQCALRDLQDHQDNALKGGGSPSRSAL